MELGLLSRHIFSYSNKHCRVKYRYSPKTKWKLRDRAGEKNTRSEGDILATQGEHVIIGQGISVAAWLYSGAVFWTYLIGSPLIDCYSSTEARSTWEQYENVMGCHVWTAVLGHNMKSDINGRENGLLLNLNICIKRDHY